MPAHWWVERGCPSGSGLSRGVCRQLLAPILAACVLMGGTVSTLLVWPEACSTGAGRLSGGARSWCKSGHLQNSHQ